MMVLTIFLLALLLAVPILAYWSTLCFRMGQQYQENAEEGAPQALVHGAKVMASVDHQFTRLKRVRE